MNTQAIYKAGFIRHPASLHWLAPNDKSAPVPAELDGCAWDLLSIGSDSIPESHRHKGPYDTGTEKSYCKAYATL